MNKIVIDLDGTMCQSVDGDYANAKPVAGMRERLIDYRSAGFIVAIHTSRNMRTYQGNQGKINALTLPLIVDWLQKHNMPYDEIYVGKPWCGYDGFYVDDRSIRPAEFLSKNHEQIVQLLEIKL
jgi:hypothetical protein